jgi:hypothetical protein
VDREVTTQQTLCNAGIDPRLEPGDLATRLAISIEWNERLVYALKFCRDIAAEELPHAKVGTGAEVALRHIVRKAEEVL